MHIRKLAEDKKTVFYIIIALLCGVFLLVSSNGLFSKKTKEVITGKTQDNPKPTMTDNSTYESQIETRLSGMLSQVEGAGIVKTMITLKNGREKVVAEDSSYQKQVTEEKDANGGTRNVESLHTSGKKVLINGKSSTVGSDEPLILKEIEPTIEGVIIVAEGGGNATVAEKLVLATETVLGVEPHKVQVFKLKKRSN